MRKSLIAIAFTLVVAFAGATAQVCSVLSADEQLASAGLPRY